MKDKFRVLFVYEGKTTVMCVVEFDSFDEAECAIVAAKEHRYTGAIKLY